MQALYLAQDRVTYLDDYPQPVPQPGEALVQVMLAGICATDLELVKGYGGGFTGVLGHEFVGVVVAAPEKQWMGQRVVGTINIGCGQCATCVQQGPKHCRQRRAVGIHGYNGTFADYLVLPTANLLPVPESVPDEAAVFTEPLAAALQIQEQVVLTPQTKTAVIGPGRLGLLISQTLALAGMDVTVIGRRAASLQLPAQLGLSTGMAAAFAEASFDLVVEVTGNRDGFAAGLRLIRPLGTLVLKSTFHSEVQLNLTKLVVDEITVIGSRCGPFAPALRLLQDGGVNVTALIDGQYALRDGLQALAHAAQPGVRKILLRPTDSAAD